MAAVYCRTLTSLLFAALLAGLCALSIGSTSVDSDTEFGSSSHKSSDSASSAILMTKILQDSKQIGELNRLLQIIARRKALRESAAAALSTGDDLGMVGGGEEAIKREASLDMDYGWGGGRFGKRMDTLGLGGRFGRSVDNVRSKEKH